MESSEPQDEVGPRRAAIKHVQEWLRPYIDPTTSLADELIAERRAEVLREEQESRRGMPADGRVHHDPDD